MCDQARGNDDDRHVIGGPKVVHDQTEIPLGDNLSQAVRVGDTVRRRASRQNIWVADGLTLLSATLFREGLVVPPSLTFLYV